MVSEATKVLTETEMARLRFAAFRAGLRAAELEGAADRAEQAGHADRAKEFRAIAEQARAERDDLEKQATAADKAPAADKALK